MNGNVCVTEYICTIRYFFVYSLDYITLRTLISENKKFNVKMLKKADETLQNECLLRCLDNKIVLKSIIMAII